MLQPVVAVVHVLSTQEISKRSCDLVYLNSSVIKNNIKEINLNYSTMKTTVK